MEISDLKILVAEDSPINILLIRKLLAKWDIKPDFAENGYEAVSAVKANNYHVILMDIYMPLMDGYEAAQEIRASADPIKSKIPIIALTASLAQDVKDKIAVAAIDDFVVKPFDADDLKGKLKEIAEKFTT